MYKSIAQWISFAIYYNVTYICSYTIFCVCLCRFSASNIYSYTCSYTHKDLTGLKDIITIENTEMKKGHYILENIVHKNKWKTLNLCSGIAFKNKWKHTKSLTKNREQRKFMFSNFNEIKIFKKKKFKEKLVIYYNT